MRMMEVGREDTKMKVLVALRNVLGQLQKTKASFMAVQLLGRLLPLFDSVRLMWEPQPLSWALGNESCPAAQPCQQHCQSPTPLPWPLLGWVWALQSSSASPAL